MEEISGYITHKGIGSTIDFDNGWQVSFLTTAALVAVPNSGGIAVFDSAEDAIKWAASGGTADVASGVRIKV